MNINAILSAEFAVEKTILDNIIALIDEGNTIPFIARYRKEKTGAMDDQKLREISERLEYLRGLDKRLTNKIGIQFHIAEDPLLAVARGTGVALKNIDKFSFLIR